MPKSPALLRHYLPIKKTKKHFTNKKRSDKITLEYFVQG